MHGLLTVAFSALLVTRVYTQDDEQDRIRDFPNCVDGPLASNKICDTSAHPAERAAALVALLEPEEKLQNIIRRVALDTKRFQIADGPQQPVQWNQSTWPPILQLVE